MVKNGNEDTDFLRKNWAYGNVFHLSLASNETRLTLPGFSIERVFECLWLNTLIFWSCDDVRENSTPRFLDSYTPRMHSSVCGEE